MGLRKMMKVTMFGAVVEYLFDPTEGARRRASLRDGLDSARLRAMEFADKARPYVRTVVTAILGRTKDVVGEVRRRTTEAPASRSNPDIAERSPSNGDRTGITAKPQINTDRATTSQINLDDKVQPEHRAGV